MHKYSVQPWKCDASQHLSVQPISATFLDRKKILPAPPASLAPPAPSGLPPTDEEEEGYDEAAPLPTIPRGGIYQGVLGPPGVSKADLGEALGVDGSDGLIGGAEWATSTPRNKGMIAKDKRKTREKRRSTGMVRPADIPGGLPHDVETVTNTSYNETSSDHAPLNHASVSTHTAPTPPTAKPSDYDVREKTDLDLTCASAADTDPDITGLSITNTNFVINANNPDKSNSVTSRNSSSGHPDAKEVKVHTVIASPADRQMLENLKPCMKQPLGTSKPMPALKPVVVDRFLGVGVGGGSGTPRNNRVESSAVGDVLKQVADMEKKLEMEKKKTAALLDQLEEKDAHIQELTQEVAQLNEELDLADEDYERLEEENKAILRVLSQFNNSAVPSVESEHDSGAV